MLRNLSVGNFKSIGSKVEIELAPLTIVTGSNSSGKSTLLQCLLLLVQTLRHSSPDRQLVLNGPLTQLGEFDEILHAAAAKPEVMIGIKIAPPTIVDDSPQSLMRKTRKPVFVEAQWTFTDKPIRRDVSEAESKTFPSVRDLQVTGYYDVGDSFEPYRFRVRRHAWSVERRRVVEGYPSSLPDESLNSLPWSVSMEPDPSGIDIRGAKFDHCLPSQLTGRFDIQQEIASRLIDILLSTSKQIDNASSDWEFFEDLWQLVVEKVFNPCEVDSSGLGSTPKLGTARRWLQQMSAPQRRRVVARLEDRTAEILKAYRNLCEPAPWLFATNLPEPWNHSVATIRESILRLRYLGPLRVQPAPIYPVATTLGAEDVGPSGEWTASVLDTYRNKLVDFIPPSEIPFSSANVTSVTKPLIEAVTTWMKYLGVADTVSTVDRGSLGHELTVSSTSSPRLPLTHVGVGVSQCLPVVVSLLLASNESMTLLEQPELHLHPAVQSRLGDFLLAMSMSGRQCFVETHSEYMVNRLRLRIAESKGTDIRDQVGILFADTKLGHSQFHRVEVNEYGSIPHWPHGFFDDTQDDIERLLSASQRKRASNARDS